ncbi:MAG: winged helix-turn-helix domain-containing tetratricopeptide repeat protein [Alphaproteobacteria bacterium]
MSLQFAECTLDPATYELRRRGRIVRVEPQVFELLVLLVDNRHRVVTRDELIERVWGGRIVSDAALSSRIKAARQAIGDDGATQRLIRTVHGRGFRFVGTVSEAGVVDGEPEPRSDRPDAAVGHPAAAGAGRPSLVVLPFRIFAADPDLGYVADGIVEAVTSALSRVRSFLVIAGGTAQTFRGREADVREIATALGVRYVVQGSLRAASDTLRVTAQMIDGESREEVWSGVFEAERSGLFDMQDRITGAIVGALAPSILEAEVRRARRQRPQSLDAYGCMLRAMPGCWTLDQEAAVAAMDLLEQAIRLDPDYALAHALLSWCHGQQLAYNWTRYPQPHRERALDLARRAAALDGGDPLVLILLGTAECLAADVTAAAAHIAMGLDLDPNSAWGWNRSGYIHCYLGQPGTASAHFERALRLSPFDPMRHNVYVGMGLAAFVGERYDDALQWIDKALLENPRILWVHRLLAACAAMAGDGPRARRSVAFVEGYAPGITVEDIVRAIPHQDPRVRERYREALASAGFARR